MNKRVRNNERMNYITFIKEKMMKYEEEILQGEFRNNHSEEEIQKIDNLLLNMNEAMLNIELGLAR